MLETQQFEAQYKNKNEGKTEERSCTPLKTVHTLVP